MIKRLRATPDGIAVLDAFIRRTALGASADADFDIPLGRAIGDLYELDPSRGYETARLLLHADGRPASVYAAVAYVALSHGYEENIPRVLSLIGSSEPFAFELVGAAITDAPDGSPRLAELERVLRDRRKSASSAERSAIDEHLDNIRARRKRK